MYVTLDMCNIIHKVISKCVITGMSTNLRQVFYSKSAAASKFLFTAIKYWQFQQSFTRGQQRLAKYAKSVWCVIYKMLTKLPLRWEAWIPLSAISKFHIDVVLSNKGRTIVRLSAHQSTAQSIHTHYVSLPMTNNTASPRGVAQLIFSVIKIKFSVGGKRNNHKP